MDILILLLVFLANAMWSAQAQVTLETVNTVFASTITTASPIEIVAQGETVIKNTDGIPLTTELYPVTTTSMTTIMITTTITTKYLPNGP